MQSAQLFLKEYGRLCRLWYAQNARLGDLLEEKYDKSTERFNGMVGNLRHIERQKREMEAELQEFIDSKPKVPMMNTLFPFWDARVIGKIEDEN